MSQPSRRVRLSMYDKKRKVATSGRERNKPAMAASALSPPQISENPSIGRPSAPRLRAKISATAMKARELATNASQTTKLCARRREVSRPVRR